MDAFEEAKNLFARLKDGEIYYRVTGTGPDLIINGIAQRLRTAGKTPEDLSPDKSFDEVARKAHIEYAQKLYARLQAGELNVSIGGSPEDLGVLIPQILQWVGADISALDPTKPAEQVRVEFKAAEDAAVEITTAQHKKGATETDRRWREEHDARKAAANALLEQDTEEFRRRLRGDR